MNSDVKDRNKRKVLLVGWDAADWKVINPLVDAGRMPHIQRLMETGVMGNIATLHPVLSPMLWTSIATGKRPFKHGIYGFYEPTPDGANVQPITNLSRKTKAIWNILNQEGLRSNVVGWWPSHPAEPIRGVMVSDMFHKNSLQQGLAPNLSSGTVFPEEMTEELAELRMDIREVGLPELYHFIPNAEKIDQTKDSRLAVCAKIFAECTSIHTAATHLMETTEWDFMAVYYDAIDHFSHGFMKYNPPRREFVDEQDFENYRNVIQTAYVYHDLMLGRLMELAGEDTVVILMSDHGFHPDHLRPDFIPMEPAGPAIEHRDLGVFAMSGPGIKSDQLVFGTTLLDIAPTILTLFDLPIGDDMDGRVIAEAFQSPPDTKSIESWDNVVGEDGQHPQSKKLDAHESEQALRQLEELGYIDKIDGNIKEAKKRAVRELNYNLARAYMDAYRFGDALPLLKELYQENPEEFRIGLQLAICYKSMNRLEDLEELVDTLAVRRIKAAENARQKLAEFRSLGAKRQSERQQQALADSGEPSKTESPDFEQQAMSELAEAGQSNNPLDNKLFSRSEVKQIMRHRAAATISPYYLDFLKGYVLSSKGEYQQAIVHLERASQVDPNRPALYIQIGEAYLKLKKPSLAMESFEKAINLDEHNPHALLGIAQAKLKLKEYEDAIRYALQSIAKAYHHPMAHYALGVALTKTGRFEKAVDAFKNAIQQNPNFAQAYRRLAFLYKNQLDEPRLAEEYFDLARQSAEITAEQRQQRDILEFSPPDETPVPENASTVADDDATLVVEQLPRLRTAPARSVQAPGEMDPDQTIIVVTGLPRSGTSLMMQMLAAGGVTPMTDQQRQADEDNPKGYFELEKVKSLGRDNSWVSESQGRSIKVIAQLIDNLPAQLEYKMVFMDRDLDEIIQSQNRMLARSGAKGADLDDVRLKNIFQVQLEQAAKLVQEKGIPTIRVPYRSVIEGPEVVAQRVAKFLNRELDIAQMLECVDPALYRNRVST